MGAPNFESTAPFLGKRVEAVQKTRRHSYNSTPKHQLLDKKSLLLVPVLCISKRGTIKRRGGRGAEGGGEGNSVATFGMLDPEPSSCCQSTVALGSVPSKPQPYMPRLGEEPQTP